MESALATGPQSGHTFHIAVMGIGFTLDTPLKVAPYGLSSVVSLVDDVLIEQLRRHYCQKRGEPYQAIEDAGGDARAKRITAYLNLLDRMTREAFARVKASSWEDPMGIRRYCEMLPPDSPLQSLYHRIMTLPEGEERTELDSRLRASLVMGSIDANIMTKLDRSVDGKGAPRPEGQSDAVAALRGFSDSTLAGAMVLSAGMNPRMFAIFSQYADYLPHGDLPPKKRVIIKVSDYRSAQVQGRFLARRGVWPYEFRIESGLNCGGHAFPTDGYLMGPILDEFRSNRVRLQEDLFTAYRKATLARGEANVIEPALRVTVQGGIGTPSEDRLLREHYGADATGWASPFLLVPEVSNVSRDTLGKLKDADRTGVVLTWSSPLGVPFWSLRDSGSDLARRARIAQGRPGSSCPKGYLALNHEHGTVPLCTASRGFQKKVLSGIGGESGDDRQSVRNRLMEPQCICHDLGADLKISLGIEVDGSPAICPGPNLRFFGREYTLEEMVGHIYGRLNVITDPNRPHQLINELQLYVEFLHDRVTELGTELQDKSIDYLRKYRTNLFSGIEHYRGLVPHLPEAERSSFVAALDAYQSELQAIPLDQADTAETELRPEVAPSAPRTAVAHLSSNS